MESHSNDDIRGAVRERYASIAKGQTSGCGGTSGCCGAPADQNNGTAAETLGYRPIDIAQIPGTANLGLGCGNPQAIANLQAGEVVLDLGSGAGIDCFLAAKAVGNSGQVIGVDMTPDMISLARKNAMAGAYVNVDFRLGEIEQLPVRDAQVDVIISNCVINLSPNKPQVFAEAFRVLKSGGRLAVSDMVASGEIPVDAMSDMALYSGCISGAIPVAELERMITQAGFVNVIIQPKDESRSFVKDWAPGSGVENYVLSATIEAKKP